MTTNVATMSPVRATDNGHSADRAAPAVSRFWAVQLVVWSVYGIALMLPWLGVYPVSLMVPNKIVVAGTGMLVSGLLAAGYRGMLRGTWRAESVFGGVAVGSTVGGVVWSMTMAWLLGAPLGEQLTRPGTLVGGIPALGGTAYHALVLLTWSFAFIGVSLARSNYVARDRRRTAVSPAQWPSRRSDAGSPADLLVRDGKRTLHVAVDELDWIAADGDYVRLHLNGRSVLARDTMARLESLLPDGCFVRVHRSAIVNMSRVREIHARRNRDASVLLTTGHRLRVSRTYAGRLRNAMESGRTT